MEKLKNLWTKIKNIKHFQVIAAVTIGLALCAIYFAISFRSNSDSTSQSSTQNTSTASEYVQNLENKLSNVLSKIDGAGSVDVVVTLECGFTYEYATDTQTKTTSSGDSQTSVTTQTVILVSNEPVVVKEIYPKIKGVVVVAEGAKEIGVKLQLLTAVETVLEIDRQNITILA